MSGQPRPKPLISVNDAADLLGISRSVAYVLARRRELPGLVELNGRYYVKRPVLLAWLAGDGMGDAHLPTELADVRQQRAADRSTAREGA